MVGVQLFLVQECSCALHAMQVKKQLVLMIYGMEQIRSLHSKMWNQMAVQQYVVKEGTAQLYIIKSIITINHR